MLNWVLKDYACITVYCLEAVLCSQASLEYNVVINGQLFFTWEIG